MEATVSEPRAVATGTYYAPPLKSRRRCLVFSSCLMIRSLPLAVLKRRLKRLCVDDLSATQWVPTAVLWRGLWRDNDLYGLACMERKTLESKRAVLLDGRFNPRFHKQPPCKSREIL